MNANLLWGIFALVWAIVSAICWYVFCLSKEQQGDRCSEHVEGKVVGVSGSRSGEIQLPLVEYSAQGAKYQITGPKFRKTSTTMVSSAPANPDATFETNLTTRENLPLELQVSMRADSIAKAVIAPLADLYPVGSKADVFFNPNKPKDAFVQRAEGSTQGLSVLLGAIAIGLLAVAIILLTGSVVLPS